MKRILGFIFAISMIFFTYSAYTFRKLSVDIKVSTNAINLTYEKLKVNMEKTTNQVVFDNVNAELQEILRMQKEVQEEAPKVNVLNVFTHKDDILGKYKDMENKITTLNSNVEKINNTK